jgi:hypothetical protein
MRVFRDNRAFFETFLQEYFARSEKYAGVTERLDELLILGDRMQIACDGHSKIGRGRDVGEVLKRVAGSQEEKQKREIALELKLEPWLKALVYLVRPEKFYPSEDREKEGFNEYAVMRDLDLYPRNMKEVEEVAKRESENSVDLAIRNYVEDPIEQQILFALQRAMTPNRSVPSANIASRRPVPSRSSPPSSCIEMRSARRSPASSPDHSNRRPTSPP